MGERMGWMMVAMLTQIPLPLLPADAAEIARGVGVVTGPAGGVAWVHGLAAFAWDAGDEAGRRFAAVQLVRLAAAGQAEVAGAFGVDPVTVWRWDQALSRDGVAGLVPARKGPRRASKLTAQVVARIRELDAAGTLTLAEIARAAGVSASSVRNALGRGRLAAADDPAGDAPGQDAPVLPVLPDPVPRAAERAVARRGLLGEAVPVFTAGAKYPLAGLLLAFPALRAAGLLGCAHGVYGRLRAGFYGLDATLITLVFLALLREARAEGATRIPPAALGRVLGLDRAPEVKTIRRKLGELAAAGKAEDLVMALGRRHAAARPGAAGFLYVDGHARVYSGTRKVQKTHVARLKFPAPATGETWVTDADGDPVFVVIGEPSQSLAAGLRDLLPHLRQIAGPGRRVTIGFDRGGWSPELFAGITGAGFDILTWRKGAIPDLPATAFSTVTHTGEHGRERTWDLADTTVQIAITTGQRAGEMITLRQVTRRTTDRKGRLRQVHILTSRTDLAAAEISYRMSARWREENYFRYARIHFNLDALDSYAATPDDPARLVPNPAKKAAAARVKEAGAAADAAGQARDAALLALHSPAPGQPAVITNQMLNALNEPAEAACAELDAAQETGAGTPARLPLGDVAPGTVRLDTETKLITHAIRMAACNTETMLARALQGHYARAEDEAYALIREALTTAGDIEPAESELRVRLEPLSAPRRTRALAALCQQLSTTQTCYPGTSLILRYEVKPHPGTA
jgi:transposase